MVDYVRDEEEQVERIKEWWQKNGTALVVTIVLSISAMIGWRQWQGHQGEQAGQASSQYQQIIIGLSEGDSSAALADKAEALIDAYPRTAYADYARLVLARLAVQDGDYDAAIAPLRSVAESGASDELKYTARLRLARVQLQQQAFADAAETLSARFPAAFNGAALELQGDMEKARGELDAARRAYEQALSALQDSAEQNRVQMKLDDLKSAS